MNLLDGTKVIITNKNGDFEEYCGIGQVIGRTRDFVYVEAPNREIITMLKKVYKNKEWHIKKY